MRLGLCCDFFILQIFRFQKLSALEIENTQLKNKLECLKEQPKGNKKQSACNEFIQMQLQLLQCEIRYLNSELKFDVSLSGIYFD